MTSVERVSVSESEATEILETYKQRIDNAFGSHYALTCLLLSNISHITHYKAERGGISEDGGREILLQEFWLGGNRQITIDNNDLWRVEIIDNIPFFNFKASLRPDEQIQVEGITNMAVVIDIIDEIETSEKFSPDSLISPESALESIGAFDARVDIM